MTWERLTLHHALAFLCFGRIKEIHFKVPALFDFSSLFLSSHTFNTVIGNKRAISAWLRRTGDNLGRATCVAMTVMNVVGAEKRGLAGCCQSLWRTCEILHQQLILEQL